MKLLYNRFTNKNNNCDNPTAQTKIVHLTKSEGKTKVKYLIQLELSYNFLQQFLKQNNNTWCNQN